jgi:uncharacterized FlaG/YvyC family protein
MDFVQPVGRTLSDIQGQAAAQVEIVRERYRQQQSKEIPIIKANDESQAITEKRRKDADPNITRVGILRHVYVEFEVDHNTREVTTRFIDADSGNLIRTIPVDKLAEEIMNGSLDSSLLRIRTVLA